MTEKKIDDVDILVDTKIFLDKLSKGDKTVDMQFGNGDCAYNVLIDWVEVL